MKPETTSTLPPSKLTLPAPGRDHLQGPSDAPFALVEYGDYQCPYCGEAHPLVKAVQARLAGQLCFVFRNFPLAKIHPFAEHAAEAAEAAGVRGKFWEMHDVLFENQGALEDEALARYAAALGLNAEQLLGEVINGIHRARVREDFRAGARSGVNGTPTFFVNGVRYDGLLNEAALVAALTQTAGRRFALREEGE